MVTLFEEERVLRNQSMITWQGSKEKKEVSLALAIAAAHSLARVASNDKVRGISTVHTPFPSSLSFVTTKPNHLFSLLFNGAKF